MSGPLSWASGEKTLNLYFVSPFKDDGSFWGTAHDFARASAKDLDINFKIFYNESNTHFTYADAFSRALNDRERPDGVIGIFMRFIGTQVLDMAEEKGVPVFMVNTNIPDDEREKIGMPRERYKRFIGHMAPDERLTGYMLAKYLIAEARVRNAPSPVEIAGLTGHRESPVSHNRAAGLEQAVEEENARLRQIVYVDWTQPAPDIDRRVRSLTQCFLKRYPDLGALWYVSDGMALAGSDIIARTKPQVAIGGIDWRREALRAIRNKTLDVSVGGHFTEVGFSLVLLYDYLSGKDFFEELGGMIHTPMALLTPSNIHRYDALLTRRDWNRIDFKAYSKVLNPGRKTYDFSFDTLLQ